MAAGDSCADEKWLFRDTKGTYGLVTPYGDELEFYDSRVVPLPEMIS